MITLIVPEEGRDQLMVFPAEEAADPMMTLLTFRRLLSKLRSKFNPATCASSCELKRTGRLMLVSPGSPEPLPAEIMAVGDPALASPMSVRRKITDDKIEINCFFMSIALDR
jgi:hypothetical protein